MKKIYNIGKMKMIVYWNPGIELDDLSLKKLHRDLILVNEESGAKIVHKMLDKKSSLEDIRHYFSNAIISEYEINDRPTAFLLSPGLSNTDHPILHTGLMVVAKNPGGNLMGLLFLGVVCMGYEKMGKYYITNISSTPSAIENFSEIVLGAWPGPDVSLKKAPRGYDKIVQKLKTEYMENYFPDSKKLNVDYKRFILKSNSQEMGFNTNFYTISRADNFKYNLFCHSWIDYSHEEDVIQVGEINLYKYLRARAQLFSLKQKFKHLKQKETLREESSSEQKQNIIEIKKAG